MCLHPEASVKRWAPCRRYRVPNTVRESWGVCWKRKKDMYTGPVSEYIGFPIHSGTAGMCVGRESDVYRACFRVYWVPNEFRESWGLSWKRE